MAPYEKVNYEFLVISIIICLIMLINPVPPSVPIWSCFAKIPILYLGKKKQETEFSGSRVKVV